jgi:hypothetical protein
MSVGDEPESSTNAAVFQNIFKEMSKEKTLKIKITVGPLLFVTLIFLPVFSKYIAANPISIMTKINEIKSMGIFSLLNFIFLIVDTLTKAVIHKSNSSNGSLSSLFLLYYFLNNRRMPFG